MQNNTKSSVVAGVLGVFLGAFGGHDWYLGNTKKAITHTSLCVGGIILLMVGLILTNLFKNIPALNALSICVIIASYVIIVGNGIWGFIEGVSIIAGGDAGLAAKGYKVAAQANTTMAPSDPNTPTTDQAPTEESKPITPAAPNPDIITATPATSDIATPATQPVARVNLADEPVVTGTIPDPATSESNSDSQPKTNPISAPFAPASAAPSPSENTTSTPPAPSSSEPAISTPVTPSTPSSSTIPTASAPQEAPETPKTPEAPKTSETTTTPPAAPEPTPASTSTPLETPPTA